MTSYKILILLNNWYKDATLLMTNMESMAAVPVATVQALEKIYDEAAPRSKTQYRLLSTDF